MDRMDGMSLRDSSLETPRVLLGYFQSPFGQTTSRFGALGIRPTQPLF